MSVFLLSHTLFHFTIDWHFGCQSNSYYFLLFDFYFMNRLLLLWTMLLWTDATSLIIREMQVKTIMRYPLSEWLESKRQEITSVDEDVEKRELLWSAGGNANRVTTVENNTEFPQEIKNRITMWFSDPNIGYLLRENENTNSKRYMHPCLLQHYLQ